MNTAKIRLSPEEMELISNTNWILTKNNIILKIQQLFGVIAEQQQQHLADNKFNLPAEILQTSPKISKGENYKGFPWLVLDFPRLFQKENIAAIRCMFWWGHFFSLTLHLSGDQKKKYEKRIIKNRVSLIKENYYFSENGNEWDHHFNPGNYTLISDTDSRQFEKSIQQNSFCKIACKIPLDKVDLLPGIIINQFHYLIKLLED